MAKKASKNTTIVDTNVSVDYMRKAVEAAVSIPSVENENAELVKELVATLESKETAPSQGDPGWTEFLMKQLGKDEQDNGKPNNVGLRRLAKQYLGHFLGQHVDILNFPKDQDPYRATVIVSMTYLVNGIGQVKMTDAFDVSSLNTREPFCFHPVATAITTAESRCLKKLLGLNTLTADESKMPDNEHVKATQEIINATLPTGNPAQKHAISNLSNKLGIDHQKLIQSIDIQNKELDKLSVEECFKVLKTLGSFERKEVSIPKEILK